MSKPPTTPPEQTRRAHSPHENRTSPDTCLPGVQRKGPVRNPEASIKNILEGRNLGYARRARHEP